MASGAVGSWARLAWLGSRPGWYVEPPLYVTTSRGRDAECEGLVLATQLVVVVSHSFDRMCSKVSGLMKRPNAAASHEVDLPIKGRACLLLEKGSQSSVAVRPKRVLQHQIAHLGRCGTSHLLPESAANLLQEIGR